ncbi:hypothetical protein AMI01nite_49650 [Aneurinibacillus migulanus]|nr:hypothetical protein AMI01nite_49650 [Aneurinibacillus migulanus]
MKRLKTCMRNLVSLRGALGLALAVTYSPEQLTWQQIILIVAVAYLWITAALRKTQ